MFIIDLFTAQEIKTILLLIYIASAIIYTAYMTMTDRYNESLVTMYAAAVQEGTLLSLKRFDTKLRICLIVQAITPILNTVLAFNSLDRQLTTFIDNIGKE